MKRLTSLCGTALVAAAAWAPLAGHAAVEVLTEGFNNVNNLPGWTQYNASVPPGTGWFQGNAGIFSAQAGASGSYAAANFLGAANGSGTVDNWLITPTLDLQGFSTLSFHVNRNGEPGFADLIEVRFGAGSTGNGIDTFDLLLGTISGAAFPASWQQWSTNLAFEGEGRFAFRYFGDASTLDYVGIDSVRVVTAVPEPSSYLMLLAGLGAVGAVGRSARRARKDAGN